MNERQWELYRLSVVEEMPDCPHKKAIIDGIRHKLMELDKQETIQTHAGSHQRSGFMSR